MGRAKGAVNGMSKTVGKVQVGQFQYEILEEGDGDNVFDNDECSRIGLCCYINQKIYIYKNMSKQRKRATLAHEICHAYLNAMGASRKSWALEDVCNVMEAFADPIMKAVNRIYPYGKEES